MLIQTNYSQIREQIRDGDIIAWGGKGQVSSLIKLFTLSTVSHVAIVMKAIDITNEGKEIILNNIIESTTLDGYSGVVVNRLSKRLHNYDGEVWWLPLSEDIRSRIDFKIFYDWLKKQRKKVYDIVQAMGSALDLLWHNKEDFDKFFCSELCSAALEISGGVSNINCSEITPAELCKWKIYQENYYQLGGELKEIKGFNSVHVNKE